MMNLDIIPEGWHGLSGFCDCEIKDEYNDDVINGIIIQLDGKNYRCFEDTAAEQYRVVNFLSLVRLTKDATGGMWCINFPTLNVKSVNSL